jgi:uncharacterized protein
MGKFTPGTYDLKVKRGSSGRGLFTYSPIKKGACIIEYVGRVMTKAEEYNSRSLYLFEATKTKTIDGSIKSNTARYVNHSCRPNCEADGYKDRVFIMALRTIKPGEELVYDYGEEFFKANIERKGCQCIKHK